MKTTFSRVFALIASLLLLAMALTGVSFRFVMLGYMTQEKQKTLSADAAAVAALASAYESAGDLEDNWDFRLSLSLFSHVGSAEALICDADGTVRICSCEEFNCRHLGRRVPTELLQTTRKTGKAYDEVQLEGLYEEKRFLVGTTIVSESTGKTSGYVFVSSPMTEINQFLHQSLLLFLYTALAVLAVAIAAASFLSRQLVRPLGQVAEAARKFGRGALQTRVQVPEKSSEEVAELAGAFNSMAESLESSERRR